METPSLYQAEITTAAIPADEYIRRFRDADRIAGYCRRCGNYGRNWSCPPFAFNADDYVTGYASALIVAVKITPSVPGIPLVRADELLLCPERNRIERLLLEAENRCGGRMFGFTGKCLHCPDPECPRTKGEPCRHPEKVRPSLEACGFDVVRTASELLGIDMKWSSDGVVPEYLTLVGAIFANSIPELPLAENPPH